MRLLRCRDGRSRNFDHGAAFKAPVTLNGLRISPEQLKFTIEPDGDKAGITFFIEGYSPSKLLFGASSGQRLRQAESRFRASKTARLTREASGRLDISVGITVAEDIPISAEVFEAISKPQNFHLQEAGKAIVACVDPEYETHLARRFLDALTWYGQAVTEPLHPAQIIKYVAAWERLTITKKYQDNQLTERVTNRMALLSHDRRESRFEETLTEVRKVYDWRSKLMHGSVSPFQKDLDHISYRASVISGNALFRSLELFARLSHGKSNPTKDDLAGC